MKKLLQLTLFSLIITGLVPALAETPVGDEKAGKRAAALCSGCHSFEKDGPNLAGPGLWGVLGRDIATIDGFRYSKALLALEGSWDEKSLDAYLKAPLAFAPGSTMAIATVDHQRRADIIAYLKTLTD